MNTPKVSIGIISYNHVAFLPTAINSALSQTFENFEIVIVDDGSTDGSLAVAQDFAEKHSNVRVFTHPNHVNKGISATCNLTIEKCRGEYIALLGSDDAFYPYTIEEQVKFLDAQPETGMVCGVSRCINENGDLLPQTYGEDIWSDPDHLQIMFWGNKVSAPTVMIRRLCYDEVGLYAEEVSYNDWEMWLRILLISDWKIGFIDKPLALYRMHNENVSLNKSAHVNSTRNLQVLLHLECNLRKEGANAESPKYKLLGEMVTGANLRLFYLSAEEGKISDAVYYLKNYLKRDPKGILLPRRLVSVSYRMTQGFGKAIFAAKN